MQPEKSTGSEKMFPHAYLKINEITIQLAKKSQLFIWTILGLAALCTGLFVYFQTNIIDEAAKLSDIIR